MSISTVTLNGDTLPHPSSFAVRSEYLGAATTLADGSLRRDLVDANRKRRFTLGWVKLSASDMSTLEGAYDDAVKGNVNLVTPAGDTVSVTAGPQPSIQFEGYVSAGSLFYRASIELWEA